MPGIPAINDGFAGKSVPGDDPASYSVVLGNATTHIPTTAVPDTAVYLYAADLEQVSDTSTTTCTPVAGMGPMATVYVNRPASP